MPQPLSLSAAYQELSLYTINHPDPAFIHQEIVDAYAAQTATEQSKPISLAFALVGLYLFLEKGMTGKEVQREHVRMANARKTWPMFELPAERGEITAEDVLKVPPGEARDAMIKTWCESVWGAYNKVQQQVRDLHTSTYE